MAPPHRNARLRVGHLTESGARNLNGHLSRLALAIAFFLALTFSAPAETLAETVLKWGLIGPWSLDCSLPPDRDRGTVLSYDITTGGPAVHRRNFAETSDETRGVSAAISAT